LLQANAEGLVGAFGRKRGCIRFRRPEQIDPTVVRALLSATATDAGPVCRL
jgi:hypothetical protein